MNMLPRPAAVAALAWCLASLISGCASGSTAGGAATDRHVSPTPKPGGASPTPAATAAPLAAYPGQITKPPRGRILVIAQRRTHTVGPAGEKWAAAHGVDYPFDNDYYDEFFGPRRYLALTPQTVCFGWDPTRPVTETGSFPCSHLKTTGPVRVWPGPGDTIAKIRLFYRP